MFLRYLTICWIGSVVYQTATGNEAPPVPYLPLPIDIIQKLITSNQNLLFFLPLPTDDIRELIHDRHCARRLLLDEEVPESDVPFLIYHLVGLITSGKPIDWLLPDLTIQNALGLYDRLLYSSHSNKLKTKLASLLVTHIDIFRDVVSAPDDANLSIKILPDLPHFNSYSQPEGISAEILLILTEIINDLPNDIVITDQITKVRSHYPPPFNRIYPRNAEVAAELLNRLSGDLRRQLLLPGVLQSLLRYGIRFEEGESFPKIKDLNQIALIYPLLRSNRSLRPSELFAMFIAYRNKLQHALMLLRLPVFIQQIRRYPSEFVFVLGLLLSNESCHEVVSAAIAQPFFTDLINHPSLEDITIFEYAFRFKVFGVIELLLSRPDFRLKTTRVRYCNPYCYMLDALAEHLERLFELVITQPIMIELISVNESNFRSFRILIEKYVIRYDQAELLQRILEAAPIAASADLFAGHYMTLLHFAFKYEAFNCATVILNVPGIESVSQDRLLPSPLYMSLYNGSPGQNFLEWLSEAPISKLIEYHAEVLVIILNRILSKNDRIEVDQLPFLGQILKRSAQLQGVPPPKIGKIALTGDFLRETANSRRMLNLLETHIKSTMEMLNDNGFCDLLQLLLKLFSAAAGANHRAGNRVRLIPDSIKDLLPFPFDRDALCEEYWGYTLF